MPSRSFISKELASLFGVLANPARVRIIEELRRGEVDVNGLQAALAVSHSRVSQHLSVLRAHRLVEERREGRHVFYHLPQPGLARWVLEGLDFIQGTIERSEEIKEKVEEVRAIWGDPGDSSGTPGSSE